MWRKRIAMTMVVVTTAATAWVVVSTPTPVVAQADRNEAIFGDFNGDRITDRVYLGSAPPDYCSIIVEYGRDDGGYAAPVVHIYLRPGREEGPEVPCPDIGVAVELDPGQPHDELVVSWFAGPPETIDYTMLVLRSFRPDFGLTQAVFQPSNMDTADFNGDDRMDVWSVTDQGEGFESYLSLGNGTLTPGPVRWCARVVAYHVFDFDRNGAQDVLIAYWRQCDDGSTGVVVVLDDGTVRQLEHDPTALTNWTARLVQLNDDRFGDVQTENLATGEVHNFIGRGDGTFVVPPQANPDAIYPSGTGAVTIDVLANDWATRDAQLVIVEQPRSGTVQVLPDNRIRYTPTASPPRTDRFAYRIIDVGRQSTTAVYVRYPS